MWEIRWVAVGSATRRRSLSVLAPRHHITGTGTAGAHFQALACDTSEGLYKEAYKEAYKEV